MMCKITLFIDAVMYAGGEGGAEIWPKAGPAGVPGLKVKLT